MSVTFFIEISTNYEAGHNKRIGMGFVEGLLDKISTCIIKKYVQAKV